MNLEGIIEAMVCRVAAEVARETVRAELARAHGDSLITREAACEILCIRETKLRQLVKQGVLRQIDIGRAARYRRSDVGAAMDALAQNAAPVSESARATAMRLVSKRSA